MADFTSLQTKVNALKAKVEQSSITPVYLGSILDDFIVQMKSIDMTGMSADLAAAVRNASSALQQAKQALTAANNAGTAAASAAATANAASIRSGSALSIAADALSSAESALAKAVALESSIGVAGGIAPLGADGIIPASFIPRFANDVVEFNGFLTGSGVVPSTESIPGKQYGDDGISVVYSSALDRFVATAADFISTKSHFCVNWLNADDYGPLTNSGRLPLSGKLYIDVSANESYRWDGSGLVRVDKGIETGESEGSAFPGDRGKKLEDELADLKDNTNRDMALKSAMKVQPVPVDGLPRDGYPRESCLGLMCPEEIPADCVPVLFRLTRHTRTAAFERMNVADRNKAKEKCYRRYSTLEDFARIRKATADDDLSPAIRYILTFADLSGYDCADENGEPQSSSLADDTRFPDSVYVERPAFCRVRETPVKDTAGSGTLYTVPWGAGKILIARKNSGQNQFSRRRKGVRLECAVAFIRRDSFSSQGKRNRLTLSMSVTDPVYFHVYPVPNLLQKEGGGLILDKTRPFLFKYGI